MDFDWFNMENFFFGVAVLLANVGSKHIHKEYDHLIEEILHHDIMKKLVLLGVVHVAARDIRISVTVVLVYIVLLEYLKYTCIRDKKPGCDRFSL